MKKLIAFFTVKSKDKPYIIRTKSNALASLSLIAVTFVTVRVLTNMMSYDGESGFFALIMVPLMVGAVAIVNLILLRVAGYKVSGIFFSSGLLLTLLTGIFLAQNSIHPLNMYVSGVLFPDGTPCTISAFWQLEKSCGQCSHCIVGIVVHEHSQQRVLCWGGF